MESETDRKREHIFLGSSDPSMPNQVFLNDPISPSIVKLPFPPHIDPYKLISNKTSMGRIPARTPNAFILYRKIFIESAHKEGYHLPMTVISSMASKSWKHEPDIVKEEYKRISKQAFEIRKQLIPKSSRKKKREKWNFVSFSNKSNSNGNSNKIEMKTFTDNQSKQQIKNFDSNPNLKVTNPLPSAPNNVNDENVSYTNEQLNYQMYDQKPTNHTNLTQNSYNNNNKDIGFESLSHDNNNIVTNIYDINQYQLYNDDGTNSTINSHSADNSLIFQSYYNYNDNM